MNSLVNLNEKIYADIAAKPGKRQAMSMQASCVLNIESTHRYIFSRTKNNNVLRINGFVGFTPRMNKKTESIIVATSNADTAMFMVDGSMICTAHSPSQATHNLPHATANCDNNVAVPRYSQ